MNKVVSDIRLFLFTCSGEDNYILKRCNNSIQLRFALIGFFVLLIFAGCFFSADCFISSLFNGTEWISLPMSIIWGALVVNIYLLLLHTISPPIIPLATKKKKGKALESQELEKEQRFLTLSMFLRMGFMILLAVIIAQPLNVIFLHSSVATSIEKHKITEKAKLYMAKNVNLIEDELQNYKEFNQRIKYLTNEPNSAMLSQHLSIINNKIIEEKLFAINVKHKLEQLNKIEKHSSITSQQRSDKENLIQSLDILLTNEVSSDTNFITTLNSISFSGVLKKEGNDFKNKLLQLVNEKVTNYIVLDNLLIASNFYVKTIQLLLAENPLSWMITFLVCLVFLLPIYFKYKVRDLSTELFSQKNYPDDIKRLRAELINTKDFNWLEKKIKSTNIHDIRTSDYYFQRMLIEHKIILEEYEATKKKFSKILTANIKRYNENSVVRISSLLDKLKFLNPKRYQDYYSQIANEYKEEVIIKYEYWLDMPFRTKRVHSVSIINNEVGLLDFVYNQPEEDETNSQI